MDVPNATRHLGGFGAEAASARAAAAAPLSHKTATVLALLIQRPGYCYEVSKRHDRVIGGLVPVSTQAIYHAVDRLRSVGYADVDHVVRGERQNRVYYKATGDGVRAYWRWFQHESALLEALRAVRPAGTGVVA
jgi:DNA-binding PadR family transcriptional regulator